MGQRCLNRPSSTARACGSEVNSVSLSNSSRSRPLKLSRRRSGLACRVRCSATRSDLLAPRRTAIPVSSVPLSLKMAGRPRRATSASSSRATRKPGERGVGDQRQALPGEVVDDSPECGSAGRRQAIGDEVEAPALVRSLRHRHRPRVPSARLRPPRRRTASPSSR